MISGSSSQCQNINSTNEPIETNEEYLNTWTLSDASGVRVLLEQRVVRVCARRPIPQQGVDIITIRLLMWFGSWPSPGHCSTGHLI